VFPELPEQPGYLKRRRRLADTSEWLMGMFAGHSPRFHDDPLLIDSSASHSRHFWGLRLHAILAPDRTPRAPALCSPNADERAIRLILPDRCQRHGVKVPLGDGGHASHPFAAQVTEPDATFSALAATTNAEHGPISRPSASGSNRILWTYKDLRTLERHRARTHAGLKERVPARICCLAAAITPNHQPAPNSRAPVNYSA
jgi:hypothetical protein